MTLLNKYTSLSVHSKLGLDSLKQCASFGVCNVSESHQVNYLINVAKNPGKGADCVISLVHHYFNKYGYKETCDYLHAENCTAQNKNNAIIQ